MNSQRGMAAARLLAPVAALAAIAGLDALLDARSWPLPVRAAVDESAHLLTAGLFLAAAGVRWGPTAAWVLLGAVVIDVDHVPLYVGDVGVPPGAGRPLTHSVTTVGALLLVAVLWRTRRRVLLPLAAGVALHLVRDLAGEPGIPLLWPFPPASVSAPPAAYLATVALAALLAESRAVGAALRQSRATRSDDVPSAPASLPSVDAPVRRARPTTSDGNTAA